MISTLPVSSRDPLVAVDSPRQAVSVGNAGRRGGQRLAHPSRAADRRCPGGREVNRALDLKLECRIGMQSCPARTRIFLKSVEETPAFSGDYVRRDFEAKLLPSP